MTTAAQPADTLPDTARRQRLTLAAYFTLGFVSIIVQALLIREFLAVFGGNELIVGVTLGLWLLWIAVGAQLGAYAALRLQRAAGAFFVAVLLGCAWVPAAVLLTRDVRNILHAPGGGLIAFWPMAGFTALVLAPFSLMVGFTFPLGLRLFARERERDARRIGWIYVVEAAGSLAGGMVFTFGLVRCPGLLTGLWAAVAGVGAVGVALLLLARPTHLARQAALLVLLLTVMSLGIAGLLAKEPEQVSVQRRFESLQTHTQLVDSVDSRYQNITLSRLGEQYNLYLNGAYAAWFPDEPLYESSANVVLSQHPDPQRVLLIGGGAEGLLDEILANRVQALHYVELDPALIELVRRWVPPEDATALRAPQVTVYHRDGRLYVKQTRERYDLVFVNLPDPSTALLNRYYTREFYEAVRRILAPGGVIAVRLSSAETYFAGLKGGYAASILRTLGDVFPYVVVMPHEWSYFFASTEPGIVTSDPDELAARFRRRGPRTEHFQAAAFHTYFYGGAAAQFAQQLRERQDVQLNTDLRPISYFYSLLLWDEYSGSKLRPHLERLQRVGLGRAIGALAVLAVLGSGWIVLTPRRAAQHRRASYLLCVAACGFAGMGLEVLLIFAFQNLYGYVYQMIGLLVAVFMFGLAVGGATMNAFLPRLGRSHASLMVVQGLIAAFALALPLTLGGLGAEAASRPHPLIAPALFGLLVGVAGLLTGLELPLASALYLRSSDRISKVAGLVDAADHGGAFVGALTCGALLIPVLGVAATCLLVGALNLSALAVLAATTATGRRGAGGQSGGVY